MNRWFNPSHPQTLQAAVFLGYLSAFFGLLLGASFYLLILLVGLGAGAFGSANNKRWGYYLLAGCSLLVALISAADFVRTLGTSIVTTLVLLNAMVFPVALAAAVLHPHSREYQKVWFE